MAILSNLEPKGCTETCENLHNRLYHFLVFAKSKQGRNGGARGNSNPNNLSSARISYFINVII